MIGSWSWCCSSVYLLVQLDPVFTYDSQLDPISYDQMTLMAVTFWQYCSMESPRILQAASWIRLWLKILRFRRYVRRIRRVWCCDIRKRLKIHITWRELTESFDPLARRVQTFASCQLTILCRYKYKLTTMDGTLDEWVNSTSTTVDPEVRAYVSSLVTAVCHSNPVIEPSY